MKRTLLLLLTATVLSFTACSNPTTPPEVADAFLSSLAKGDQEKARKYASDTTIKLLDIANTFGGVPTHKGFKFTLIKSSIDNDKALVVYTDGINDENKTLALRQIDGAWKVDESKK